MLLFWAQLPSDARVRRKNSRKIRRSGESSAALEAQLKPECPKALVRGADAAAQSALDEWMAALDENLSNGKALPELPLDLRGAAFQIRVWRFLLSVKPGDVASYSEIAAGIEAPRAIRAAATACGANRLAILVPCHRALRANGELGGYRWGLERKRALLDSERAGQASRRASRQ